MTKQQIEGMRLALDILYWKKGYFGGSDSWDYICAELSDKLPGRKFFRYDEKRQVVVIDESKPE